MARGKADILFGMQRGDEGKGRFIDGLVSEFDYAAVARYGGGPNAGHTVVINGQEIALHQIPSGVMHPEIMNVCGNGMVIDPIKLHQEIKALHQAGVEITPENLAISSMAYVIMPHHIYRDKKREAGNCQQGSTASGIAYAYADKAERTGGFAKHLVDNVEELLELAEKGVVDHNPLLAAKSGKTYDLDPRRVVGSWEHKLRRIDVAQYIANTFDILEDRLASGRNVLLEGAQGYLLDIEAGMLPYVTSSDTGVVGAQKGTGINHKDIGTVRGVVKLFPSHVGGGPFVSDIENIDGEEVADVVRGQRGEPDGEFGKTTGRKRRVGYLDLPALRAAHRFNGVDEILLAKLDVAERLRHLGSIPVITEYVSADGGRLEMAPSDADELKDCLPVIKRLPLWKETVKDVRQRKDLPKEAESLIDMIEQEVGVPVTRIGVGYEREQLINA